MTDITSTQLLIPNLATMGVRRMTEDGQADLETIWRTPYPVIRNYRKLMRLMRLPLFGGGTIQNQRMRQNGFITSGYRDEIVGGNKTSPHRFAIALDFIAVGAQLQIDIATEAVNYGLFRRVGFYPVRGFMHVDIAPHNWIRRYNKCWYWVNRPDRADPLSKDIIMSEDFEMICELVKRMENV